MKIQKNNLAQICHQYIYNLQIVVNILKLAKESSYLSNLYIVLTCLVFPVTVISPIIFILPRYTFFFSANNVMKEETHGCIITIIHLLQQKSHRFH